MIEAHVKRMFGEQAFAIAALQAKIEQQEQEVEQLRSALGRATEAAGPATAPPFPPGVAEAAKKFARKVDNGTATPV